MTEISTDDMLPTTGRSPNAIRRFLTSYVFSTDHKIIGMQFLFSSLIWLCIGGLLALAVRWQLAWPS